MVPQTETQWILLGLGTMVFIAAALRVLAGESRQMLEYHFLMRKAMRMRNRYAEQILSLQPKRASSRAPTAPPPSPTATAGPAISDAPAAPRTETDFGATTLMPDETSSGTTGQAA